METVIALAPNLFYGTSIAVIILVLSKHKTDTRTQFIDASELFKVDYDAIVKNDYNLSVSSYVEAKDTREKIDIQVLNAEIKTIVAKIDKLRAEIDAIIAEIEG